ncbi:DUF4189 domain-containing protein [Luteimonas flava]|uniref:DUF4189 domain-containing protein n=1 Tax=Luteimonas flava TaxID=3115822 RepID=UPI003CCE40C9
MTPSQQAQVPESNPNSSFYNSRYLPSLGASDPHYPWIDRFGAYAMSRSTGWSGWAQDAASEESADSDALEQCRVRSGGVTDCEIIFTFQNQCGAVVRSERHTAYGRADELEGARDAATRRCEALGGVCEVFREGCSLPELRR